MNLIANSILFLICLPLWYKSGIHPKTKYFWTALVIIFTVWFIWGQIAIADGWWTYNANNIGGRLGYMPITDILYFLAGVGWFLYLLHELELI